MDALMAFVSIIAIIAIVVVAGGLVAFIAHMIIGAFDNERRDTVAPKEVLDYSQYKQLESAKEQEKVLDNAIDTTKVEEEKLLAEEDLNNDFNIEENETTEEDIQELENALKEEDESEDDLDDLLSEISNEIIDEEKENIAEEETPKMSDELAQYSIDDYLNGTDKKEEKEIVEESAEEESTESIEEESAESIENVNAENIEESKDEIVEDAVAETVISEEIKDEDDNVEEYFDDIDDIEESESIEEVKEEVKQETEEDHAEEIARLKAELADLNKKLADATNNKVEVVTINATEEECVARLAILEERLKNVKKDYKINMKEYRPLKKVMSDYERYQTKLRRKDAMVAKKKVALYGVNNYVDIDKDKAEKLSNELELLNGLRLSVSHCEEVINANKDRYPILEHTNKILEDQITNIEADIAATQETLRRIREENGDNGENNNSGENNE